LLFDEPSTYSEKKSSEQSCATRVKEQSVRIKDKIDFINVIFWFNASKLI
jgi:hypothetical protein